MGSFYRWLFWQPRASDNIARRPFNDSLSLLQLHNAYRTTPLLIDAQLTTAAEFQAMSMYNRGLLDHSNFTRRSSQGGFWAENVAWGVNSDEACFDLWWSSAPHRANMMNPNFTRIGYAKVGLYWCAVYS